MIAKANVILSSLNKRGTNKKEMPERKNNSIDKLNNIEEKKLSFPEWDSIPPKSLKKLCVKEYPTWEESWMFPPW